MAIFSRLFKCKSRFNNQSFDSHVFRILGNHWLTDKLRGICQYNSAQSTYISNYHNKYHIRNIIKTNFSLRSIYCLNFVKSRFTVVYILRFLQFHAVAFGVLDWQCIAGDIFHEYFIYTYMYAVMVINDNKLNTMHITWLLLHNIYKHNPKSKSPPGYFWIYFRSPFVLKLGNDIIVKLSKIRILWYHT